MEWVKLSHGFIRDEKMHFITKRYGHDAGLFWPVLLSEVDDAGVLQMDIEVFSELIMLEAKRLDEIILIYLRYGLVTRCNADSGNETLKIANWEKYQYSESYLRVKKHRQKAKGEAETSGNGSETEKKRECNALVTTDSDPEEDKEKNRERGAKRARALTDDFVMQECSIQWAMHEKGWTQEKAQEIALAFKDYWLGTGKPMKDWEAVWRNWVRRESNFSGGNGSSNRSALKVPPVTDERGLMAMAKELGIKIRQYDSFHQLRQAVLSSVEKLYSEMH